MLIDIERVTNIDELFDNLISKGENHSDVLDERIPYWAELWPSALALSIHLTKLELDWSTFHVHEIGSGLALPSIVAGKLGAKVTVTDYLPEAVEFAEANWKRNTDSPAEFRVLDWRVPTGFPKADLILAADIAYEQRMFNELPNAFKTLCKSGGKIFLSEPNRAFAQPFLERLAETNFKLQNRIQVSQELFGQQYKINILELQNL